jgi:hypothetical protein
MLLSSLLDAMGAYPTSVLIDNPREPFSLFLADELLEAADPLEEAPAAALAFEFPGGRPRPFFGFGFDVDSPSTATFSCAGAAELDVATLASAVEVAGNISSAANATWFFLL